MTVGYIQPIAPDSPTPFAVAARDLLRNTALDAARTLLLDKPWPDVTMSDIARAAGVSRQTLYNEFGSRHGFAQAYVLRETDRFIAAVETAVHQHLDDPATALAAAFTVFLTAAAEDPLVRSIVSGDGSDELLALVTTQGEPVLHRATDRLSGVIVAAWPDLPPTDTALLAETVVRLAISYAALPAGPAGMTAASISTLLGPYIEQLLERIGHVGPARPAARPSA